MNFGELGISAAEPVRGGCIHRCYRATRSGTYYLQVMMATAGSGRYRLSVVKA